MLSPFSEPSNSPPPAQNPIGKAAGRLKTKLLRYYYK